VRATFCPQTVSYERCYERQTERSSWYDSEVELMTEQNVYGGKVFAHVSDGSTVSDRTHG
jgi:hypothetical protein